MADEERIELIQRALLEELRRQGERHGVSVDDNGVWAQVDGSFKLRPIALAILTALDSRDGQS